MNRDDIIRMGHEAGLCEANGEDDNSIYILQYLERFAELIAAAAAAAECEAIVKYLETKPKADRLGIINAIRARGKR
jgi:hypothetical protein